MRILGAPRNTSRSIGLSPGSAFGHCAGARQQRRPAERHVRPGCRPVCANLISLSAEAIRPGEIVNVPPGSSGLRSQGGGAGKVEEQKRREPRNPEPAPRNDPAGRRSKRTVCYCKRTVCYCKRTVC